MKKNSSNYLHRKNWKKKKKKNPGYNQNLEDKMNKGCVTKDDTCHDTHELLLYMQQKQWSIFLATVFSKMAIWKRFSSKSGKFGSV